MTQIIRLGRPPIEVTVKKSTRSRRLSLRVSGVDGRVSLTIPHRTGLTVAQEFLSEKEDWIRQHLSNQPVPCPVTFGQHIPVEGAMRQIVEGSGRAVRLFEGRIELPAGDDKAATRVRAFLKTLARDRLAAASGRYAAMLGRTHGKISLRDTRSRWGSCSSQGNLMYSWRLILAPPDVLDYVAAHEVAHLVEMNHSPQYWAQVERLMPDYQTPRRWLRENGASLHRYRF